MPTPRQGLLSLPEGCCCEECQGYSCCCLCFPDTICFHVQSSGTNCDCDAKAEARWTGHNFGTFVNCGDFVIEVNLYFDHDPADGNCRVCLEYGCHPTVLNVSCRRFGVGEYYLTCDEAILAPWTGLTIEPDCGAYCSSATITAEFIERHKANSCSACGCLACLCASIIDDGGSSQCIERTLTCWYDAEDKYIGGFDCPQVPYFELYFEPTIYGLFPGSCDLILSIPGCGSWRLAFGEYTCADGELTAVFDGLDLTGCGGGANATISFFPSTCNECGFGSCCHGQLPESIAVEVVTEDGTSTGILLFDATLGTGDGCWLGSILLDCEVGGIHTAYRTLNLMLCCTGPAESGLTLTMDCDGGPQSTISVTATSCDPFLLMVSGNLPPACVPCLTYDITMTG